MPTVVPLICPCQRPGAAATRACDELWRSGRTTPTETVAPLVAGPVTVTLSPSPLGWAWIRTLPPCPGSVQPTMRARRAPEAGDWRNALVQSPVESLVQATDRPRP